MRRSTGAITFATPEKKQEHINGLLRKSENDKPAAWTQEAITPLDAVKQLLILAKQDLAEVSTANQVFISPTVMNTIVAAKSITYPRNQEKARAVEKELKDVIEELTQALVAAYAGITSVTTKTNAGVIVGLLTDRSSSLLSLRKEWDMGSIDLTPKPKHPQPVVRAPVTTTGEKANKVQQSEATSTTPGYDVAKFSGKPQTVPVAEVMMSDAELKKQQEAADEAYAKRLAAEEAGGGRRRYDRGDQTRNFIDLTSEGGDRNWTDRGRKGGVSKLERDPEDTKRSRRGPSNTSG